MGPSSRSSTSTTDQSPSDQDFWDWISCGLMKFTEKYAPSQSPTASPRAAICEPEEDVQNKTYDDFQEPLVKPRKRSPSFKSASSAKTDKTDPNEERLHWQDTASEIENSQMAKLEEETENLLRWRDNVSYTPESGEERN